MRMLFVAIPCIAVVAVSAWIGATDQDKKSKLNLRLRDADSGKAMSGVVRIRAVGKNKPIALTGLYPRLKGLSKTTPGQGWFVVPKNGADLSLPAGAYQVEAIAGLETALATRRIELGKRAKTSIELKLKHLFRPSAMQLASGNTHLHLRNMTLKEADEYLRTIPPADGLDVLFISHLRRHKDDKHYITNRYPIGNLEQFDLTGVLVNNGEEHRHNFGAYKAGYGHVMFLDIKRLIKPASIGPGIMGKGVDDQPLRTGIDDARKQGGTVVWCHNTFGYEDVLNAVTGRLHAINVFDGSRRDKLSDSWYDYLNVGIRMPISTGTDWFMYDFSRVYAKRPKKLTIKNWLNSVKKGQCQATNGPLLTLTVENHQVGDVMELKKAKTMRITARAIGRQNFDRLQIVFNGKVIHTQRAEKRPDRYIANVVKQWHATEPGWLALRIDGGGKNEFELPLFAHTSPIYVRMGGKDRFDVDAARKLIRDLEQGKAAIRAQGAFSNEQAKSHVLAMYDQGIDQLQAKINKRRQ